MVAMILYSYSAKLKCGQLHANPQIWGNFSGLWPPLKFGPLWGDLHLAYLSLKLGLLLYLTSPVSYLYLPKQPS